MQKRILQLVAVVLIMWLTLPAGAVIVARFGRSASTPPSTGLDTNNTYVNSNLQVAYLFDDGAGSYPGSGTTVHDYTTNETDGTLANATWENTGVLFNADNETVTFPFTSVPTEISIFMIFTSESNSGEGPTSGYGQFFVNNSGTDNEFQFYRASLTGDTGLRAEIDGVRLEDTSATDVWDTTTHSILVTFNNTTNEISFYIDGVLEATQTTSFGTPTVGTLLAIGNKAAGGFPIMGTLSAFYMWDTEYELADALSLHNNPYQLFLSAPSQPEPAPNSYYVTQSGTGDGSSAGSPMSVAAYHSSLFEPGDTIYFSGAFSSRVYPPDNSGTSANPITLDGYAAGDCDPINSTCTSSAQLNAGMEVGDTSTEHPDYLIIQDLRMTRTGTGDAAFIAQAPSGETINHFIFRRNDISMVDGQMLQFFRMQYAIIEGNKAENFGQNYDISKGINFIEVDNSLITGNEFAHDEDSYPAATSSAEMIELHGCNNLLFEYNNIHGAPDQSGIRPKESYGGNNDLVIRYNKIHDNKNATSGKGIHMNSDASSVIDDVYIYGNFIYDNGVYGISDGNYTTDVFIWSNLLIKNGNHGFVAYGTGSSGFTLFNNTFAQNGDSDPTQAARGGIVLVGASTFDIQNNILADNRPSGGASKYYQLYSTRTIGALDYNTHYHSSSTANFYYDGAQRSLAIMQGTYSLEANGDVRDPQFVNPDGADTTHGTDDDDYTLDSGSNEISDGDDLSFSLAKTVDLSNSDSWFETETSYSTISMTGNEGLDPDTDWSGQPSAAKILTLDRDVEGWERGAYVDE